MQGNWLFAAALFSYALMFLNNSIRIIDWHHVFFNIPPKPTENGTPEPQMHNTLPGRKGNIAVHPPGNTTLSFYSNVLPRLSHCV